LLVHDLEVFQMGLFGEFIAKSDAIVEDTEDNDPFPGLLAHF
jgi:hypothetical protein